MKRKIALHQIKVFIIKNVLILYHAGLDNERDDENTSASSQEINRDSLNNSGNETEQPSDSFIEGTHLMVQ